MTEENRIDEVEVFRNALVDDNVMVQIDAVKKLPVLAAVIEPERTRTELIPCLTECVEFLHDEILYNLSEQLQNFVPLVGGEEHVGAVLDLLVKLSYVDETIVRDKAVDSIKTICQSLGNADCERVLFPLIEDLVNNDWFTSKCSAAPLFAVCYPKVTGDKQESLITLFKTLIQDESPMVRRAAESGLVDFVGVLDSDHLKNEFVAMFENLASDEQDSVRVLAIDVGLAIAKQLGELVVKDCYLLTTFKNLCVDTSWRVRQRVAYRIHEIQGIADDKSRESIIFMYQTCARDIEAEVRAVAAKNLYSYCLSLRNSFRDSIQEQFEHIFEEEVMPQIHRLVTDENDQVRFALSESILSLSVILSDDCFKLHILPLVLEALENEESMPFKENILRNLNSLPLDVDISKSFRSIDKVIRNLLQNSHLHWRTRRNILVALLHITKKSSNEFFDSNLKNFYLLLLADPVFAIRRTTPLILPFLAQQFGIEWAEKSLVPTLLSFAKDQRYLFRYVVLYCVKELICPFLNPQVGKDLKYLFSFKQFATTDPNNPHTKALVKIVNLNDFLMENIDTITNEEYTDDGDVYDDKIELYAEDTILSLKANLSQNVFAIAEDFPDQTCYLEGVLVLLNTKFITVIKMLMKDHIRSVKALATATLQNVKRFCQGIKEEQEQLKDILDELPDEFTSKIKEDVYKLFIEDASKVDEEAIDLDLASDQIEAVAAPSAAPESEQRKENVNESPVE